MPERTDITYEYLKIQKELTEKAEEYKRLLDELISSKLKFKEIVEKSGGDLAKFNEVMSEMSAISEAIGILLMRQKISSEDLIKISEDLSESLDKLEDITKTTTDVMDKLRDKTKEYMEKVGEHERGFTRAMRLLEEGIPIRRLGDFGRTVASVGGMLQKFFDVSVPLSFADALKKIVETIDNLTQRFTEVYTSLAMAYYGEMEIGRSELYAFSQYLRGLGHIFLMSEREIREALVTFRVSGLQFSTDVGRILNDLQRGFLEGTVSASEFANGVRQVLEPIRALGLAFGMSTRQVMDFMREWRPLLLASEVNEIYKAMTLLHQMSAEYGIDLNMLINTTRDVMRATRLYGIDIYQTAYMMLQFREAINMGVVTAQDFVNVLVRGREAIDPGRHGSVLWFMANFGTTPEVREMVQRFLSQGAEGITAFTLLLTTRAERLREVYDTVNEDMRRLLTDIFKSIGAVDQNNNILWERVRDWQLRMIREQYSAIQSFTSGLVRAGDVATQTFLNMTLFNELLKTNVGTLDDYVIATEISRGAVEGITRGRILEIDTMNEFNKVLRKSIDELNHLTPVINDVRKAFEDYRGRIVEIMTEGERRAREVRIETGKEAIEKIVIEVKKEK